MLPSVTPRNARHRVPLGGDLAVLVERQVGREGVGDEGAPLTGHDGDAAP